jgi:hypothetical protein
MLKEMKQHKRRNVQTMLFFLMLSIVISCNRCKEDCDDPTNPECPNYVEPIPINPCAGAEATSADFIMYQSLLPGLTADTLIQFYHDCVYNKNITLHALQDSCEYDWIIGADNYYTRDVTFNFGFEFVGQSIPLKLSVTRTPNTSCFPNDNGLDTLVKTVVPKVGCDASIWGKYYGAWDESLLDSFVVELLPDLNDYPFCGNNVGFIGLNPDILDTCFSWQCHLVDNYIQFDNIPTFCYNPVGSAFLDSTKNKITVSYSISETNTLNTPRSSHLFKGHRIN